ncbi:MAG: hypothetical protein ACRDU8_03035 [Egibacteraceae bacterium]
MGTTPALTVVEQVGVAAIHDHDVRLANRFLAGLELPPSNSAIVSVAVDESAATRLDAAGVAGTTRDGRLRLAFHLYNTDDDVDAAQAALRG